MCMSLSIVMTIMISILMIDFGTMKLTAVGTIIMLLLLMLITTALSGDCNFSGGADT